MHLMTKTCWLSFLMLFSFDTKAEPFNDSPILGPDAAACQPGAEGPAILVHISGFKDRKGQVRLELYSDKKEDFLHGHKALLARNAVFKRIDVPTPPHGAVAICLEPPGPGRYSLVVLHDRNGDGKFTLFKDGVGFPNNPRLGLHKPDVSKVSFEVSTGITTLDILLNYMNGMTPAPVKHPQ